MSVAEITEDRVIDVKSRPGKFAHVVIRTARYDEMREFYKILLGGRSAFANDFLDFIRYDDEHHRVVIMNTATAPSPAPGATGMDHIAYTYGTLGELLGTYQRMKENGFSPVWSINHGLTTSIYYADPDGNMIETQVDNMDNDAADAFMRGPYFAVNPIGVDFDPELLAERYSRGDPAEELIRQGSAPWPRNAIPAAPPALPNYDRFGDKLAG
jgi:catechol 2,3-dioxygenase-like lactoylglutathione lyase family enzyme